jgi:hypothetical protein
MHQSFTTPYAITALDICYEDYASGTWQFLIAGSGTFSYSVNGGATQTGTLGSAVTVTNTGGSTPSTTTMKKVAVWGLASSTYTVSVGVQSAAYVCIVQGITCYPNGNSPSTGLMLARMGCSSGQASEWWSAGQTPANRVGLHTGKSPQSDSGSGGNAFGFPFGANLLIMDLGLVDALSTDNEQSFIQSMAGLIEAYRRGNSNCSVILHVPYFPGTSSDVSWGSNQGLYGQYVRNVYALARLYNCAVVNTHARWGMTPYAAGYLPNNDVHPTDAGHAAIAGDFASIL